MTNLWFLNTLMILIFVFVTSFLPVILLDSTVNTRKIYSQYCEYL